MKKLKIALGLLILSAALHSCIKEKYDNPPDSSQINPNVVANVSIADLSNMILNAGAGSYHQFTGDSMIGGIVTADDRTGNFYKQIVIQDSTGGIVIALDRVNLYVDYPVGRQIFINLKNLELVDYKGIPEIVFNTVNASGNITVTPVPSGLFDTTVIKGSYPHTVTPVKIRFSDIQSLGTGYCINRLVTFENMEFDSTSLNLLYASPSIISSGTNRIVHDCPFTSSMVMYNSGYATFQPVGIPDGKGTITGIFSVYNTTPQFLIRDTSDVQLTASRDCP